MSADKAHLLGLIGLRALAELDPIEFRRVADLSKRDLDHRIESLLKILSDSECNELYHQIVDVAKSSESQPEADMLLKQLYLTSFHKSQYESLLATKEQPTSKRLLPSDIIESRMAESSLEWIGEGRMKMKANLLALNSMVAEGSLGGNLFACLGEVASDLCRQEIIAGNEEMKEFFIWRCCADILELVGFQLREGASANGLWIAAQERRAEEWLRENALQNEKPAERTQRARRKSRRPL